MGRLLRESSRQREVEGCDSDSECTERYLDRELELPQSKLLAVCVCVCVCVCVSVHVCIYNLITCTSFILSDEIDVTYRETNKQTQITQDISATTPS